jgi:iron complex outermembrane receptor protein
MKSRTSHRCIKHCAIIGTGIAALASPCWAQQAEPSEPIALEQIVVTATRRSESILNVPLSVTAFDERSLDRLGIKDVADLTRLVPGVSFSTSPNGATHIALRGISSQNGASTTGVYIDDTPIQVRSLGVGGSSANAYPAIFDLERVEVLRGPQGTLFGASSEGGTVRFITPEPNLSKYSFYSRAEHSLTAGGDPNDEIGAAAGGPIVQDRVGFRISAYGRHEGGWIDRVTYPTLAVVDKSANGRDTAVLQGVLSFAVTDHLIVTPGIYFQQLKRKQTSEYWREISDPASEQFLNGQPVAEPGNDRFTLSSLKAKWDSNHVAFFSNTSYFDRSAPQTIDYTNFVSQIIGQDPFYAQRNGILTPTDFLDKQQVFTQEVRLQSQNEGKLKWLVGAFYQRARQQKHEFLFTPRLGELTQTFFNASPLAIFGEDVLPGGYSFKGRDESTDKQIAGFTQLDYLLLDRLTATAGVRVGKLDFSFTNNQDGPINGGPTVVSGDHPEHSVTPKFGLNYKVSGNLMVYATAAKGFRSGGANTSVPADRCRADLTALGLARAPDSFISDSIWSYEIGSKARFLDGKAQVEASVFYINWTAIQNAMFLPSCGYIFIENIGAAANKGADLQLSVLPVDNLTLSSAVGYNDAHYTQTVRGAPTATGASVIVVEKGDQLRYAPSWHLSVSADYELNFTGAGSAYFHAGYDYNSSYQIGPNAGEFGFDPVSTRAPATRLVSARLGMRFREWDVSVFANNLLNSSDVLYTLHRTFTEPLILDSPLHPRTVGLTAAIRY